MPPINSSAFLFRVRRRSVWSLLVALLSMCAASAGAAGQAAGSSEEISGIDPVLRALCSKQVALLGESPVHGFGETLEFKSELVRRLVDQCHYNAIVFESGVYDFVHIQNVLRSGGYVTDAMTSAAIGGIWSNKEVQSLVPFLTKRARAGRVVLGGLDDQIGEGTYASSGMASDLSRYLPEDDRTRCLGILEKHLSWQYTDKAPYSPLDKEKISGCLQRIKSRLGNTDEHQTTRPDMDKMIIESFERDLARDFTEDDFTKSDQELKWVNDRERSMYMNFRWLYSRLPRHSKVIVWAATVHISKDLSGIDGFQHRLTMGSLIEREFGKQAFSLGFSAYSGDYAFVHQPVRAIGTAPVTSLEGNVFVNDHSDAVYLSREQLRKHGSIGARVLGTSFKTAHWDKVLDGLVIFRKEHVPTWLH